MYKIDENVRESVAFALRSEKDFKKALSNTIVAAFSTKPNDRGIEVHLFGNHIFSFYKTGRLNRWWVNNCGWPSKTTQERLNDALVGVNAKYRVYVSKGRQMIRNITTGDYAILGDGKVESVELKDLTWKKNPRWVKENAKR